ncbi:MAG TPA: glycosyltransferase [Candidatus Eisenbacteria bacterium]|nr:glycosyltransferase [Candidatus Eisenbacteria bacterium]
MQRVAVVITRFIAGAGGVALRGALALDPTRYSVTILAAAGGPLLAEAEKAGFEVVRLRHMVPVVSLRTDPQALRELTGELRNGRFDIVHTHSAKAGALGRIAAYRVGVPAIVHTFHGFPFHDFQLWPLRAAYIQIEKRLGRITDQFLAVGGAVAAQAINLRIAPAERIRTIASAIDLNIPPASPGNRAAARRLMDLPDDALVVGTVGRLAPQKAPQDMVAAIAAMDRANVYCVWVGDGPMREEVARLVERRNLGNRFLLLGERRDVAALLPGFDVFALSSHYEGLPCSLVEAMTCGLPVVATAVNAVPEVVVPGRTGMLVPAAAPALLGRALAYLLDHPSEGSRMAAAARVQLGDRFDPEVLGRDLAETYEMALTSSTRTSSKSLRLVA